jgi:zinc/manganese transport system permease protein
MVTPAATAQYLSRRPGTAIALSVGIALMATWAGLFVGFYTIYPVSFFITAIAFSLYILVRLARYGIRPKMATQVSKRK